MRTLSPRQQEILKFLESFVAEFGMAPSLREVAEHFGIAPATASGHLRALQKKHALSRSNKARSIVLTAGDPADAVLKIPVYGRFGSPSPEDNEQFIEGVTYLHRTAAGHLPRERLFALRVNDESLRELGIFRGDTAVFAPPDAVPPRLGDVVAAFVGDRELIRSFFPRGSGGTVMLRAAHPGIPGTELKLSELRILGVLIALQRNYSR